MLTNTHGDPVLSTNNAPIQLNATRPYQVHDDGTIQQDGAQYALMLVAPKSLGDLTRVGDTLFSHWLKWNRLHRKSVKWSMDILNEAPCSQRVP